MARVNTAIVRDASGNIVAFADYRSYHDMPEHIKKLANKDGYSVEVRDRRETKGQGQGLYYELGQRREQVNASNQELSERQEREIKEYDRYSVLAERSAKQNVGQRVPEQKKAEQSYSRLEEIHKQITANNELLQNMQGSAILSKSTTTAAQKAAADAEAYRNRNQTGGYEGLQITDESGKPVETSHPRNMTRAQADEFNKKLIEVQMPYIIASMKPKTDTPATQTPPSEETPKTVTPPTPIVNTSGIGTESDPFKNKQPDRSLVSPYLGATYWTAPNTEKTFTTKSDAEAYLNQPQQMVWTVGDRTFKSEEHAQKFIERTTPKGESYIGYSNGKPIQGAPAPLDKNDPRNFLEASSLPQTFTGHIGSIDRGTMFIQDTPVGQLGEARYSSNPTVQGIFEHIDKSGRGWSELHQKAMKESPNSPQDIILSGMTSAYAQTAGLVQLTSNAGEFLGEKITGKIAPERKQLFMPKTLGGEYIGGSIQDISQGKINLDVTKGKGVEQSDELWKTQSLGSNVAQVGAEVIPIAMTGGIGLVKKGLGISSKAITLPLTAVTTAGRIVPTVVKVATEYNVFGKTLFTKTLKNPTVIKIETISNTIKTKITEVKIATGETLRFSDVKKAKQFIKENKQDIISVKTYTKSGKEIVESKATPVDKSGVISFGKTSPKDVLSKGEFNPIARGYEVYTGEKAQTRFNVGVVEERVRQGKMTPDDLAKMRETKEGVDIVQKYGASKAQQSMGDTPLQALNKEQNLSVISAIRNLQSPINFAKLRTRIGAIGGSGSEQVTLRKQFTKEAVHDFDIDVKSEKIAQRGAKTVFEKVQEGDKFQISSGRGTKVEVVKEGQPDEFVEFLSPKDVLKGNLEAQKSGQRFGYKYRSDKLSKLFKRPIKDPEHGVKVRDPKDQLLAKASSTISIQGKSTEKFKGEAGLWEAKQNKMIEQGIEHIAAPALRGKDEIGLYRHFKSQAVDIRESGRIKEADRLDEIAENLRSKNPELDYNENLSGIGRTTNAPEEASSISLISGKIQSARPPFVSPKLETTDRETISPRSFSSRSTLSPRSVSTRPSSSSIKSTASPRSISVKSPSTKSPSVFSPSPKSPSVKSPSTKSPSVFSPSPKSPSPRVPSPTTPSPKTPSPRPPSPKSPSPRTLLPPIWTPPIFPPRPPIAAKVDIKSKETKRKTKSKKNQDFLGNTRLDKIEGFFKRTEIISGDVASAKQLRKDIRFREGKSIGLGFSGKKLRI